MTRVRRLSLSGRALRGLLICVLGVVTAAAQAPKSATLPALDTARIVSELVKHNQERLAELKHYEGCRHYSVRYSGFPSLSAEMTVEVQFDAPAKKEFHVIKENGSGLLLSHVLKELLVHEKEAAGEQSKTALTPDNYEFRLVGTDTVMGRPQYVLEVIPRTKNKYLYRGKIWVDGTDFAVSRIVAAPASNPSIWISNTEIEHEYKKIGEFWLPAKNTSITKVRFGGGAKLNIDYLDYRLGSSGNGSTACADVPQLSEQQ